MGKHLFDGWCDIKVTAVSAERKLHLLGERDSARKGILPTIVKVVHSHYEDPRLLAARIKRLGYKKAAKLLEKMLPESKTARSGHLGEIFAAEAVPAILPSFKIPLRRLRWLDARETALRGEDVIGLEIKNGRIRFLKGESKSRAILSTAVVVEARGALNGNGGRPSQHAMTFIMHRLFEQGDNSTALIFEAYLLEKTISIQELVHFMFVFSGNDGAVVLEADLRGYQGSIEQHTANMRIVDHQGFIRLVYQQ